MPLSLKLMQFLPCLVDGAKILIVDDDIQLREYTAEPLISFGYSPFQTGDADNLIIETSRAQADLIILDFRFPGVDGLTALRKLRKKV